MRIRSDTKTYPEHGLKFEQLSLRYENELSNKHVVFQFKLPSVDLGPLNCIPTGNWSNLNPDQWCEMYNNSTLEVFDSVKLDMQRYTIGINNTMSRLNRKTKRSRARREIYNPIGGVISEIFSLVSIDQFNELESQVKGAGKNQLEINKILAQEADLIHHIVNTVEEGMDANRKSSWLNHEAILSISRAISEFESDYSHFVTDTGKSLQMLLNMVINSDQVSQVRLKSAIQILEFRNQIKDLYEALMNLENGLITPVLLPKHELQLALTKIQSDPTINVPQHVFTNPYDLYQYFSTFWATETDLFIVISIPKLAQDRSMQFYSISKIPLPIHGTSPGNITGYLELKLPSIIALNADQNLYFEAEGVDLMHCVQNQQHNCILPTKVPRSDIHTSCAAQLLINPNGDQTKRICNPIIINKPLDLHVLSLGRSEYLLTGYLSNYTTICNANVTKDPSKFMNFTVHQKVRIPCECEAILNSKFHLYPDIECETNTTEIQDRYVISSLVIHNLKLVPTLKYSMKQFDTMRLKETHPIYFKLPLNVQEYYERYRKSNKKSENAVITLHDLSKQIANMSDEILDGTNKMSHQFSVMHFINTDSYTITSGIVNIVLHAVVIVLILNLYCKSLKTGIGHYTRPQIKIQHPRTQ